MNNEMYLFEVELIDMQLFDEMMGYKCQQLQMEQSGYLLEDNHKHNINFDSGVITDYSYDKDKDTWTKSETKFKEKGFFTKVWAAIKKVIAWFIKTMKTIWHTIIGFFSKIIDKIKFFFSSVKDYKPTPEDLKFQVSWRNLDGIKKMYDSFMKMKTFAEVSSDELEYIKSSYKHPSFLGPNGEVLNDEDIRKEAEKDKKEIGKIPQLSSPKAVMDVTIQLKDIIRRLESRSNTIMNSAIRFEDMCKSASEKADTPNIYNLAKLLSISIIKSCSALLECFKINLKAATSTMAHFVECQKKSKKSESKSESFMFDYEYEYQW